MLATLVTADNVGCVLAIFGSREVVAAGPWAFGSFLGMDELIAVIVSSNWLSLSTENSRRSS